MKKHEFILKRLLIIFISILAAPYLVLVCFFGISSLVIKRDIIKKEKRHAMKYSRMSKDVYHGKFQDDFEKLLQDQIIGRDFFMNIGGEIDNWGAKYYSRINYVGKHKVMLLNGGKNALIDDKYFLNASDSFNDKNLITASKNLLPFLNSHKVHYIQELNSELWGDYYLNNKYKNQWNNVENALNQESNNNKNFIYKPMTFNHDWDAYLNHSLWNDHHPLFNYNKEVTDYIFSEEGIAKPSTYYTNETAYVGEHKKGSLWNTWGSPKIPQKVYLNKIHGLNKDFTLQYKYHNQGPWKDIDYDWKKGLDPKETDVFDPNAGHFWNPIVEAKKDDIPQTWKSSYISQNQNKSKKIMIIGDSFNMGYLPILASNFKSIYFFAHVDLSAELISNTISKNDISSIYITSIDLGDSTKIFNILNQYLQI